MVLWRDAAGDLKCIDDFCPHRGAPLSYGEIHNGHIGCRYHGVIVDGEGVVQRVPAMPECALEGRKAVKAYKVREAHDAVFVYLPSADRPDPPDLALPKELTSCPLVSTASRKGFRLEKIIIRSTPHCDSAVAHCSYMRWQSPSRR